MALPRCKVSLGKRFRNPLDVTSYKPIRLTSAVPASDPMTSMVSLLPAIKPNLSQSDRIQIIAADLTDAYGRPIDGNDDGVPGGNFVATLSRSGVTFGAVPLALARTTGKPRDLGRGRRPACAGRAGQCDSSSPPATRAGGRIDVSRAPSGLDWDRKTGFMAGVRRAARRGEDRPCPRIGSAAHRCASGAAKEARARRPAGVRCGPRSPPGDRLESSGERRRSHRWHGSFTRPGSHTFSTIGFAVGPLDGVGRGSPAAGRGIATSADACVPAAMR